MSIGNLLFYESILQFPNYKCKMTKRCAIKGCDSIVGRTPNVHFFSLPMKNPQLLDKWMSVVNKLNLKPNTATKICSLHFQCTDFIEGISRVLLKRNSVPSINLCHMDSDPLKELHMQIDEQMRMYNEQEVSSSITKEVESNQDENTSEKENNEEVSIAGNSLESIMNDPNVPKLLEVDDKDQIFDISLIEIRFYKDSFLKAKTCPNIIISNILKKLYARPNEVQFRRIKKFIINNRNKFLDVINEEENNEIRTLENSENLESENVECIEKAEGIVNEEDEDEEENVKKSEEQKGRKRRRNTMRILLDEKSDDEESRSRRVRRRVKFY